MPDARSASSTRGTITVTGCARLIQTSLYLVECILIVRVLIRGQTGRIAQKAAGPKFLNCNHMKLAQYTITARPGSMFNSTHTLIGLTINRTGPERWVSHAALTGIIAANLPDIDILAELGGMPSYLEHHRGITHTFIGVPLLSLVLAAIMFLFTKNFWKNFLVSLIVMST